jgi:hypothetical protein
MMPILIQAVGLLAAVVNVFNVQMKTRRGILAITIVAATLWTTHYFLLGALTGAAMNAIGLLIVILFYFFDKTKPAWVFWLAMAMIIVAGAFAWKDGLSIMPIIGTIFAITAFWQSSEQTIRKLLIITSLFWLVYNVIVLSYVGAVKEVFAIGSALIALWRYRASKR